MCISFFCWSKTWENPILFWIRRYRHLSGPGVRWPWRHHVGLSERHTQEAELSADPAGCCWCLKLLLFGHCVALICLWHWRHIKAEKGTRLAFSGRRAYDWSGKRLTARTSGLLPGTAQELAPKLEPPRKQGRKTAKTADGSACSLCLCRASPNRDIELVLVL